MPHPRVGVGGSRSSSRPSQGSGTVCLSSCWLSAPSAGPSPEDEDGLRHRDAAVCLHLGSGSPSLLHVVVTPSDHLPGPPPSVLSDLEAVHWRRGQGRGSSHRLHHTQLTQPLCLQTGTGSPPAGSRLPENRTVPAIRLLTPEGKGSARPSGWEWSLGRGCLPLRAGAPELHHCSPVMSAQRSPPGTLGTFWAVWPLPAPRHLSPPLSPLLRRPLSPIRAVLTLGSAG